MHDPFHARAHLDTPAGPLTFYRAPTAEALAGIYHDIAGELSCPVGMFGEEVRVG